MKNLILVLGIMMTFSLSQEEIQEVQSSESLEIGEKEDLLSYFRETFNELENETAGLSEAQLQYKPAAEVWSISQILEHIFLTEKMLFDSTREQMNLPPNPERKVEVKMNDEDLIIGMVDRSHKVKTSGDLEGEGKYASPEAAMEELAAHRNQILDYINNTSVEDFRNHISDSPMGPVDAYQSMLFIAGHTARHTLQIQEVKDSEGFPTE